MFITRGRLSYSRGTPVTYTTTPTTLASQGGLLINIDSATGDIAQTASGWIEDEKFGFNAREFATSTSAEFDTAVTRTGTKTLKLSTLDATGRIRCFPAPQSNYSTAATNLTYSHYYIPCKGSTKYRYSIWIQTNNVAASSTFFRLTQMNSAGTSVATTTTSLISGDTPMTLYTGDFTTVASSIFIGWEMSTDVAGNIGDAWFDVNSMTLEEVVEPVADSLNNVSPSIQSFKAVGSTDNIDQSFTTGVAGIGPIGNNGGVTYILSQSFTATKSKHTGAIFWKLSNTGTPTGNLKVDVRTDSAGDPTATILATYTIPLATYNAFTTGAEFTVNLPCNLTAGTKYHYVLTDTATETSGNYFRIGCHAAGGYTGGDSRYSTNGGTIWLVNGTLDFYFKTLYYKPTTNFKASQNNTSISISADEDGFLEASKIDLTTGRFTFDIRNVPKVGTGIGHIFTDTITTGVAGLIFDVLSGTEYQLRTGTSATYVEGVLKIELPYNLSNIEVKAYLRRAGASYSTDGVSYTTMYDNTGSSTAYDMTYNVVGTTNALYIKLFSNNGFGGTCYYAQSTNPFTITANVDTSTIPTLYNYPTNKDVTEYYTTTLGSPTTSATYRATKWGFPAIEYSATEYQFLNIDTTATGGVVQFSELGSVFTTVADGASLAITSTSTPLLWVRTNITANRLFISSNDYNASSDKDGSMKQSLVYQVIQ